MSVECGFVDRAYAPAICDSVLCRASHLFESHERVLRERAACNDCNRGTYYEGRQTVDLGDRKAKAIAAGYSKTCAILDNDLVKCW